MQSLTRTSRQTFIEQREQGKCLEVQRVARIFLKIGDKPVQLACRHGIAIMLQQFAQFPRVEGIADLPPQNYRQQRILASRRPASEQRTEDAVRQSDPAIKGILKFQCNEFPVRARMPQNNIRNNHSKIVAYLAYSRMIGNQFDDIFLVDHVRSCRRTRQPMRHSQVLHEMRA